MMKNFNPGKWPPKTKRMLAMSMGWPLILIGNGMILAHNLMRVQSNVMLIAALVIIVIGVGVRLKSMRQ